MFSRTSRLATIFRGSPTRESSTSSAAAGVGEPLLKPMSDSSSGVGHGYDDIREMLSAVATGKTLTNSEYKRVILAADCYVHEIVIRGDVQLLRDFISAVLADAGSSSELKELQDNLSRQSPPMRPGHPISPPSFGLAF